MNFSDKTFAPDKVVIEAINSCFGQFCSVGFSYVIGELSTEGQVVYSTLPPEWLKTYLKNEYFKDDPVLAWSSEYEGSIRWQDIPREPRAREMFRKAASFGLKHGTVVSTRYRDWPCAVSLVHNEESVSSEVVESSITLLKALGRIHFQHLDFGLSDQVLRFAYLLSAGCTEDLATEKMGVSRRTGQNWKRKLIAATGASSIYQAVIRATTQQ